MAVIGGPSGAIASVVATLTAQMPTELSNIWTLYGDAATTPQINPKKYYRHERHVRPEYPHVAVYASGGSAEGDHAGSWVEMLHKLTVEGWIIGDSEDLVQEQCARHAWAAFWSLKRNQQLDGNVPGLTGVSTGQYAISVVYKAKNLPGKILQGWRLPIVVHVTESAV